MKCFAVFLLLVAGSAMWGQAGVDAAKTIRLDFSNPKLIPATWTLELHPDGSGHFRSQRGDAPRYSNAWLEPPDQDRDVQVSAALAENAFSVAAAEKFFDKKCEGSDKVAFQGTKHFVYTGPDGHGECSFNYSRDRQLQQLGEQLMAVAATILEGARLEQLHLHDRLGLDKEMQGFAEMLGDGRAVEPGVIRGTLESLANDEAVLERVRRQAREMLEKQGIGNRE